MTNKLPKLSFKKNPKETGLAGVGNPYPSTKIQANKKWCGSIHPPTWKSNDNLWRVSIMVIKSDIMEDKNPNCPWRWVHFSKTFETVELAREWVKEHWTNINERYQIRIDD